MQRGHHHYSYPGVFYVAASGESVRWRLWRLAAVCRGTSARRQWPALRRGQWHSRRHHTQPRRRRSSRSTWSGQRMKADTAIDWCKIVEIVWATATIPSATSVGSKVEFGRKFTKQQEHFHKHLDDWLIHPHRRHAVAIRRKPHTICFFCQLMKNGKLIQNRIFFYYIPQTPIDMVRYEGAFGRWYRCTFHRFDACLRPTEEFGAEGAR